MSEIPKVLLMISTSMAYGRGLLRGIARYAQLHGPWEFHRSPPFYLNPQTAEVPAAVPDAIRMNGIIAYVYDDDTAKKIIPNNVPAVVLPTRQIPSNLSYVGADDPAIAKMAAEHLFERGFKNFAYCGFNEMWWSKNTARHYQKNIENLGYELHIYSSQTPGNQSAQSGDQIAIIKWLKSIPRPVAVFACNDDRARDITAACKAANLSVPEEVAVLGADNDEFICELTEPALSSIALDTEKAGFEAAELLDYMIRTARHSRSCILTKPTHVVTRKSTDILAVEDTEVARALNFIRQHAKDSLQVTEVVESSTLSRRSLEQRFRSTINRSIHEEIRRARTDQASHLLAKTKLPVAEIARRLSFPTPAHFSRFFRRETKITPFEYRRKNAT